MGISFDRPAARMREYLQILMPLLRGEGADVHGEFYTYTTEARGIGEAGPVSCGIAALAPVMLRLAGELAGGTVLWMANAAAIEDYIKPRIDRAAANANAGQPEIITSLPIALTDDVRARARRRIVSSRRTEHCRPTVRSSIRAALRTRETRRSSATRRSSTPSSIALRRRGSRSSMPRSSVRNREARAALGSTSRTGYGAGTASDSPRAGSTTLS
jgi:alkanesulfonate monooxygenase SsuD/methylene tetrahydromethanopterin reductase-like flavin-dependent oxidoreductase (luciferase family)